MFPLVVVPNRKLVHHRNQDVSSIAQMKWPLSGNFSSDWRAYRQRRKRSLEDAAHDPLVSLQSYWFVALVQERRGRTIGDCRWELDPDPAAGCAPARQTPPVRAACDRAQASDADLPHAGGRARAASM